MSSALGGAPSRRALNDSLIMRATSQLTLGTTATSTSTRALARTAQWTCPSCQGPAVGAKRHGSSNSQWKARQTRDHYARDAKVTGLKSRAAFKLLELDARHRLFRRNQTVIDLGFAPGSWSQVAQERTKPHGIVVGIDLIPAQPPRGVTAIQGDFLSPQVRRLVRDVCVEQVQRKRREERERKGLERKFEGLMLAEEGGGEGEEKQTGTGEGPGESTAAPRETVEDRPSYIDMEKIASHDIETAEAEADKNGRMVDVIISDMSEPWPQTSGFTSNTLSRPYYRLMNTSGMAFRDHAGSMDLCYAALTFASDNLKHNGHFVCKFYAGAEDKLLQTKLQKMFQHVYREKPDSSRKDSKEAYFVALMRKGTLSLADVEGR